MTVQLNDLPPYERDFQLRAGGLRMSLEPETWKKLKAWFYGILATAAALLVATVSALAGTHL